MFKATGKGRHYQPANWRELEGTSNLLKTLGKNLKLPSEELWTSKKGRYGGTFVHPQVALAYAEYLSPEFHSWALGVIHERIEEHADPELGINRARDRAVAKWRQGGWSESRITARLQGIDTRKVFTYMLAKHGVRGTGFRSATNSTYIALMGGNAKDLREDVILDDSSRNIRYQADCAILSCVKKGNFYGLVLSKLYGRYNNRPP